jgi:ABC transporter DrrB family efflux protein
MPMAKLDLLLGYAIAFGAVALVQALLAVSLTVGLLGLDVAGPLWALALVAVLDAILGTTLGLFVSAFAETEFQAVQFMPALVIPQLLLCGLFLPRSALPDVLEGVSDVLPLSYAVDAMRRLQGLEGLDSDFGLDIAVITCFVVAAVSVGAATLRRRTG